MTQPIMNMKPSDTHLMTIAGLKLFFALADRWDLTQQQQLVLLCVNSRVTLNSYKNKLESGKPIKLTNDQIERLSLIAGIRKGVEILFPKDRWDSYMKAENKAFGGASILDVMLQGTMKSLYDARGYLDSNRGVHFG